MRKPSNLLLLAILAGILCATSASAGPDWDEAVAAYKAGNHAEAVAAFTRYVERMPDAYQGHQMLGSALLRSGDAAKAAAHLQRAAELKPGQPSILLSLGQALVAAGKSTDACTVLDRVSAEALDARLSKSFYGLRARAQCGDALSNLNELANATNSAEAWARYGVAAQNAEDFSTAVEALAKAAALAPNDIKVRRAEALARLDLARATAPNDRMEVYRGAIPAARLVYEAAAKRAKKEEAPIEAKASILYADALIGARDLPTAAIVLEAALQASPKAWSFNYLRGRVFMLESDYDNAIAALERALNATEAESEAGQTLEQLGFAYEKTKRFEDAIAAYRKVGNTTAMARAEANQTIAIDNEKADAFNRQRDELLTQQRAAAEALERIRAGGPPPTPNR